jgi:hypothetical protein
MTIVDGKTISDCFALIARCGTELEGLKDALGNLLSEQLKTKNASPFVLAGNLQIDDRFAAGNNSAWVYTDSACSFPLKSKGKRRTEGYLGFQISMAGDGIAILGNAEPLLHIFFREVPVDFDDGDYIGFPLDVEESHKITNDRLLNWSEGQWTYSLRLMSINSIEDLNKYVVEPALALLSGENVIDALPDEWLGKTLIRYPDSL